jgi:cytochrome c oxidase cbb3-type subunit 3
MIIRTLATLACTVALVSCQREQRNFREIPAAGAPVDAVRLSTLEPGTPTPAPAAGTEYTETAYAISQGRQLYGRFNCVGCHSHGGGGMGPPLMDDTWIYGSDPANIFASIVEGRPNGMPTFGSKIPRYQIWQLASYVRSLSGLAARDAMSSRADEMMSTPAQNVMPSEKPVR